MLYTVVDILVKRRIDGWNIMGDWRVKYNKKQSAFPKDLRHSWKMWLGSRLLGRSTSLWRTQSSRNIDVNDIITLPSHWNNAIRYKFLSNEIPTRCLRNCYKIYINTYWYFVLLSDVEMGKLIKMPYTYFAKWSVKNWYICRSWRYCHIHNLSFKY